MTLEGGDTDLAEKVVQRTMCRVVQKIGSYRGEAQLFTWLCQIRRNESASVYRQRGVQNSRFVPIEDHPAIHAALESISIDSDTPKKEQNKCCTKYRLQTDDTGNQTLLGNDGNWLPLMPSLGVIWQF